MSAHEKTVGVGIVGGGLMGREIASAFARWCAMEDCPVTPRLVAVADKNPQVLEWFERRLDGVAVMTDYQTLLARDDVEVVYVAVPHTLHEEIYTATIAAGKDLLAEKPFGIDLAAAKAIVAAIEGAEKAFVRCSSEFPFFPGAHAVYRACASRQGLGRIMEVNAGFHHASDLDPDKAANWKRLSSICGEIGVLGDLGMHVMHLPLRLGWRPRCVHAQLQKGYPERPGADGARVACDTWDNARLNAWATIDDDDVPMRLEMKRMAPGETNTWFFEVLGTEGGYRFSTKEPKTLWTFDRADGQTWKRRDLGFATPYKAVTGGIFEVGFADVIQQMWAAFLLERAGLLNGRFGCVLPQEALDSHRVFAAALESQKNGTVVPCRFD